MATAAQAQEHLRVSAVGELGADLFTGAGEYAAVISTHARGAVRGAPVPAGVS